MLVFRSYNFNGELYEKWQIAGFFPVKPLHSSGGLQTLIYIVFPAFTYTKCYA